MTAERNKQPPPPPPPEPAIVAAAVLPRVKVRPAAVANYSRARREPALLVIHCTDGCEGMHQDDTTAAMFGGPLEKRRSAHYVVDADSVTRCVPDMLTAWHAGHHGNALGIGIELCGRANQTRAQWLDPDSLATLALAARLCADLCREHRIPAAAVNEHGLVAGDRGITTHAAVSAAWRESDHYDPGPGFPLGSFVAAVARARTSG
jgi:N-acetyl-anhydromuramyl-L-alanine amidase AmpD